MSSLAQVVEQWTGNPKAAGSIPVGRQFFALLVLSSCRSGGSSLGFRAVVAFRPEARKTIKILKLWPANVKKHLN